MGMPVLDYSNPLVILKNVGQTYIVSKECYMFDNTNLVNNGNCTISINDTRVFTIQESASIPDDISIIIPPTRLNIGDIVKINGTQSMVEGIPVFEVL